MERLTYFTDNNDCCQVKGADDVPCYEVCDNQAGCKKCPIDIAMRRLAAYEDTGLNPEEIMDGKMLTGWIPVEEQLPKPGNEVLAYIKHNYVEDGWRAYRVYEYTDHWVGMENLCDAIAWMPLPDPYTPNEN